MLKKEPYEEVKLELILLESSDIVTSSPLGNDGNSDGDGWTTPTNDGNW